MSFRAQILCLAAGLSGALALSAAPLSNTNVDAYDVRAGTETFAALYKFTTNTALVETARAITNMGSDSIKFYMGSDASYQEGITLPSNVTNLMTEARDCPSYHQVLDMPFRHFIMWEYPLENSDEWWGSGYNTTDGAKDYSEMYGLTKYLLTNYNNSGKTFYLGHWEGDGYLSVVINGKAWATNPAPQTISGMIGWLNNRQKAVDDAKAATPHTNVFVYNYAEANRVRDAMFNGPTNNERVINDVIPYVTNLDYLSYSSYDAQNLSSSDLYATLNYMQSMLPTNKASVVPAERMWVGEYGWGGDSPGAQEPLTRSYIQRLLGWSFGGHCLPYILFWEMYNNQTPSAGGTNFFLISPQDTKAPCYYLLNYFLNDARMLVAQYLESTGTLPGETQFSTMASPMLNSVLSAPVSLTLTNLDVTLQGPGVATASATFSQGIYGDDEASVWVYWGRQNGGSNPASWEGGTFLGLNTNFNPVVVTATLTNLAANANYYFAFYASNATAQVWVPAATQLSTTGLPTADYAYRAKISFPGYPGSGVLADYPMLVELGTNIPGFSYSQFASPTGGDLRFTDAGGLTPLSSEINQWSTNGVSTVWVQLPALSGTNDFIWAYWGNAAATNPLPYANIWSSYIGVWHLEQKAFDYLDSTGNYPAINGVAPLWSTTHIGAFQVFNGTSDYLNMGPVNVGTQFTLSAWVNVNPNATNIQTIFANKPGGWNSAGFSLYIDTYNTRDQRIDLETGDGTTGQDLETGPGVLTFGTWHFIAVNVNETAETANIYIDGTNEPVTGGVQSDFPNQTGLNIGRFTNSVYYFNGAIDEARIASGLTSSLSIFADFLSYNSNKTLVTISPVNPQPALSLIANLLSWPAADGAFTLYQTTSLTPPITWTPATNPPPTWLAGQWQFPLPSVSGNSVFYRLQAR
ncbi:MAG TPA: LamG-like jellyroll fold domain-containing protein [Verrucomicrobiae bacterium]|nr:LamG-like jellyroll fold domain-containing protein [Verrucomicrobiae bacterium]